MRLITLELQNFRNYAAATIRFDQPRTIFIGENGRGKSTLVDAIEFALTGRCRGVDGRGVGRADLVRHGAPDAMVRLVFDHGGRAHTIERRIGADGKATGSHEPAVIVDGILGVSPGMLSAVLAGHAFFRGDAKDGKALLLRLLDVRIAAADVPEAGLDPAESLTVADVDRLYHLAYAERPILKRQKAGIMVPDLPPVPPASLDHMESRRTVAWATSSDLQRELGGARQRVATNTTALESLRGKLQNVDALAAKIKVHEDMLATAEAAKDRALTAQLQHHTPDAKPIDADLSTVKNLILRIQNHDPAGGCVLNASIPCHTAAEKFRGELAGLRARVETLEGDLAAARSAATKDAELKADVRKAAADCDYHTTQLKTLGDQRASQADIVAEIATRDADVAPLAADVVRLQALVDQATADYQALDEAVGHAKAYQRAVDARATALALVAKVQTELDRAEARVKLFGPKGISAEKLQGAVGEFEGMINAALGPFGFELRFQIEPWKVLVLHPASDGDDQPMPFDMLSKGEQLWTAAAFQVALAVACGLDCAILDDVEAVVGDARAVLTKVVMLAPVGQVIVAMAKAAGEPAPDVDGLQVVRVGDLQAAVSG